jgi:hypothetical protein
LDEEKFSCQYAVLFFKVYMHQHGLAGKYFFYWSNLLHFIFSIKLVVTFFVLNQDNLLFALMQKVTKTSRQTRLLRRFASPRTPPNPLKGLL